VAHASGSLWLLQIHNSGINCLYFYLSGLTLLGVTIEFSQQSVLPGSVFHTVFPLILMFPSSFSI
jgi:hypothetical protein